MILSERLRESIKGNEFLSDEQNGFRINRRNKDNIIIVRELIYKCKREDKRRYFAFLDIKKAYDRVNRDFVYCFLENVE